jgi:hypothetical protein
MKNRCSTFALFPAHPHHAWTNHCWSLSLALEECQRKRAISLSADNPAGEIALVHIQLN